MPNAEPAAAPKPVDGAVPWAAPNAGGAEVVAAAPNEKLPNAGAATRFQSHITSTIQRNTREKRLRFAGVLVVPSPAALVLPKLNDAISY